MLATRVDAKKGPLVLLCMGPPGVIPPVCDRYLEALPEAAGAPSPAPAR